MKKITEQLAQPTVWEKAQVWEAGWWSKVYQNTLNEEQKQLVYAEKMGLNFIPDGHSPYWIDADNKTILDIGSGGASLLLKAKHLKRGLGIDPLYEQYPAWVKMRYQEVGISVVSGKAEDLNNYEYPPDEVWIYNCLQHTENPEQIIKNAKKVSKIIRIFEWIETEAVAGHPQILLADNLNKWLGGEGRVEYVNKNGATGNAFYGCFKGDLYE